jgi:hypothetical protein
MRWESNVPEVVPKRYVMTASDIATLSESNGSVRAQLITDLSTPSLGFGFDSYWESLVGPYRSSCFALGYLGDHFFPYRNIGCERT